MPNLPPMKEYYLKETMKKYIKFFKYLLIHKWYVMIECFKNGLIWRGLVHDLSKFLPSEFIPYANYFYGEGNKYLQSAILIHQKRNIHHWQWWVGLIDEGGVNVFEITEPYFAEMMCDWVGANLAHGRFPPKNDKYFHVRKWYKKHKKKIILHPKTRKRIEKITQ